MKSDFLRLNTVLKLPENVAQEVISMSQAVSVEHETFFVLGGENFHPHITLYSPEYPAHNLEKIYDRVAQIASQTAPVICRVTNVTGGQGYVGLGIELTPDIKRLHENLVSALNPLREGHVREKYLADYHMNFGEEVIENVQKYGYPSAMSRYHSHITVTRLRDENEAEQVVEKLKWEGPSEFIVTHLGMYEMGEHGTCTKLLKEFRLDRK